MASLGACLIANEPLGLGEQMLQRRIEGKSWKEIADEFDLGSPSTARAKFKKLTGINDFKSKGQALKQIADAVKGGTYEAKAATQAVKAVDNVVDELKTASKASSDYVAKLPIKEVEANLQKTREAVDSIYGDGKFDEIIGHLQSGKGYGAIKDATHVQFIDVDRVAWDQLLVDKQGNIWKAYLEKPTSENGFAAVTKMVNEARAKGLTIKEVSAATDVPEGVINAIGKNTWKHPLPGAKLPDLPTAPQVSAMTEPVASGGNFKFNNTTPYNDWSAQLGNDMTANQLSAVRSYTGSGYTSINGALRSGRGSTSAIAMDGAMRPIPFDTKVVRQCGHQAFNTLGVKGPGDLHNIVGHVFSDNAFFSTTIREAGTWSGSVRMEIEVPKGTMCRWVGQGISQHTHEQELILGRQTKLLIMRVESSGRAGDVVTIIARAI